MNFVIEITFQCGKNKLHGTSLSLTELPNIPRNSTFSKKTILSDVVVAHYLRLFQIVIRGRHVDMRATSV